MHGEQVLQAVKEIKKNNNKASLILFRWVYFLSKANVENRIKIRDSMLTWLKSVTNFRSHAKGHTILYDVYYQPRTIEVMKGFQNRSHWFGSVHTSANPIFYFSNKNGKRNYYLSLSYLHILKYGQKKKKRKCSGKLIIFSIF